MLTRVSSSPPEDLSRLAHLSSLEDHKREVTRFEEVLIRVRARRDEQIRVAVAGGLTEREAARAAGVSPSWAHKAAVWGRFARTK